MKIIQINSVYEIRSTGRNVKEIDQCLKNYGHESYIAATRLVNTYENVYQVGNRIDWNVHAVLSRLTGHQGYFSHHAAKKLIKFMNTIKPDIVHIQNIRANAFNYPLLFNYLKEKRIPVVVTLHDCFYFTGRCWHYTKLGCYQWETGCRKCPSDSQCEKSWFYDPCKQLYDDKKKFFLALPFLAVVGVSDWITSEAKRSFFKDADIIKCIYNWVNLDVFRPYTYKENQQSRKKYGLRERFVILIAASIIGPEKGADEFQTIAGAFPDSEIVVVGRDIDRRRYCRNLKHIDEIHNVYELARLFSLADVFLNMSPEETFGKTSAEAMSCGTPVVGYKMTATKEIVGKGCGELSDYKKGIQGLVESVKTVKRTGKEKYSLVCREYAEKHFDMKKNVDEYIRLYERMMIISGKQNKLTTLAKLSERV